MELTSSAFGAGGAIPRRYTCDGEDVSPPLRISGVPDETLTLALLMEDPDAPGGTFDHWVAYDIPLTTEISEGAAGLGTAGRNSFGTTGYGGPCPPRGRHRYVFRVFALDSRVGLAQGASKAALLRAIQGHIIDEATLVGNYAR